MEILRKAGQFGTKHFLDITAAGSMLPLEVVRDQWQQTFIPVNHPTFWEYWVFHGGDFHNGYLFSLLIAEGILGTQKNTSFKKRWAVGGIAAAGAIFAAENPVVNTFLASHIPFISHFLGSADNVDTLPGFLGIAAACGVSYLSHRLNKPRLPRQKKIYTALEPKVHEGYR